jgi:hypothetical protein
MLPPQAPPAHVSHANQPAIDVLERMLDTQRWLVEQRSAMPDPPADLAGPEPFLSALDTFWDASVEGEPGEAAVPRRRALASRLARTLRDDASLRRNDGTMSDEAAVLAGVVARQAGGTLPPHLHADELLVGDVPYAGALVLRSDRDPDLVLLFTVETGWQAFDTLDALYRHVEPWMRARLATSDELPGVAADDMERVIDTHFLGTRSMDGDVAGALAERLVARQRERAALAWKLTTTAVERHDALHAALDPHLLLDVHAMVGHRDLALAAKREEERLARQPAAVREHWLRMAGAYRDSARSVASDASVDALPLEDFAEQALAEALRARGIQVPPRDLRVRVTRRVLENPVATAVSGFPRQEMSLLDLAYRNTGFTEGLEVVHADGKVRDDVSASDVRAIVRELDLPTRYARHLDDTLGDSAEGRQRRKAITALQLARMRFEAADARLSYHDDSEPRSFIQDRDERGFEWVRAVLDHPAPAQRARVGGHEIVVRQITYRGAPLSGVFMLAARQEEAVQRVVLYTPDAPDGIAFREYPGRAELTRQFLLNPRFRTYLLDRLPAAFATVDRHGARQFELPLLNDGRTLQWVLSVGSCDECTKVAERFEEREVNGSFLDAAYDTAISLAKRNASDPTRSALAATVDSVFDVFWYWNLPVQLTKEVVTGVAQAVPRAAQAAWRFYDNVKSGDGGGAFLAFTEGYVAGLNVLPLYTQVPRLAGASVRAAARSRDVVASRRSVPDAGTLFDKRFRAHGLRAPAGEPASGVYAIEGYRVIRQDGKLYHVRYDATIDGWRLTRPGNPYAYGPPVERLPGGQWRFRRVGLLGGGAGSSRLGMRPLREDPTAILTDSELLNPEVAQLSMHQREVLVDALYRSLPASEYAHTLRHMLGRDPRPNRLSVSQQEAWRDALQAGYWAPAQPLRHALLPDGTQAPFRRWQPPLGVHDRSGLRFWITPGPGTPPRVAALPEPWWPQHVYAYLPGKISGHGTTAVSIALQELRVFRGSYVGIPVTTLPPTTPVSSLPAGLAAWLPPGSATTPGTTLGAAAGQWVRIDLRNLSRAVKTTRRRPYRLLRVDDSEAYLLRPVSRDNLHADIPPGTPVRFFHNEFELGGTP